MRKVNKMESFNKFNFHIVEKELYYNGEVIVKYSIEYPEIIVSTFDVGSKIFNQYNKQIALQLKEFAEGEFYKQAKETYKYNKQNGHPIMVYELIRNCNVTYNFKSLISMYFDEYTFTFSTI